MTQERTQSIEQSITADEQRECLRRVLESVTLANRLRLREFLRYVGQAVLDGRSDTIKEQTVAVAIFGKAPDYRPAEDNIVRVTARQLRSKIEEYYATEGKGDTWRIHIPRGTYVPKFIPAECSASLLQHSEFVEAAAVAWRYYAGWMAAAGVTVLLALTLVTGWRPQWPDTGTTVLQLVQPKPSQHILVICADASLQMEKALTGRSTTLLADYQHARPLPGNSGQPQDAVRWLESTQLIGVGNAPALAALIPAFAPGSVLVRHPRQVSAQDFIENNAILLSGPFANPWVQLFEPKLNYQIAEDPSGRSYVRNVKPQPGEQAEYHPVARAGTYLAYSRIAYLPNLSGHGRLLLIGGPSSASTQMLASKLAEPSLYQELKDGLRVRASQPMPYFEALVEVIEMGRAPSKLRLLGLRRTDPREVGIN